MPFLVLHVVCSFLLDLAHVLTRSDHDKDLEILLLRQQLRLYERQAKQPRPSRWEKVALSKQVARSLAWNSCDLGEEGRGDGMGGQGGEEAAGGGGQLRDAPGQPVGGHVVLHQAPE